MFSIGVRKIDPSKSNGQHHELSLSPQKFKEENLFEGIAEENTNEANQEATT